MAREPCEPALPGLRPPASPTDPTRLSRACRRREFRGRSRRSSGARGRTRAGAAGAKGREPGPRSGSSCGRASPAPTSALHPGFPRACASWSTDGAAALEAGGPLSAVALVGSPRPTVLPRPPRKALRRGVRRAGTPRGARREPRPQRLPGRQAGVGARRHARGAPLRAGCGFRSISSRSDRPGVIAGRNLTPSLRSVVGEAW